MTAIDRCKIFIAIFIATFIVPFDENRLKPNRSQGLSPFTTPIDFLFCYENCENIVRCAKLLKPFIFASNKMLHFPPNYFFHIRKPKKRVHEPLQLLGSLPIAVAHQMLHQCNIFKQALIHKISE